jgi:glyoxylase-like metal-dependent hydrolase (beta-lactamase superfamily II)
MNEKKYEDLGEGITCIDTGYKRPQAAAAYLVIENARAGFVDTGTFHSVSRLLAVLRDKGLSPEQVDYVMPTHVHLDHAGGAGELMRQLPNAKLVIHPRGARHMIDPQKLIKGVIGVYGEDNFQRQFGTIIPVPEERVIIAEDEFTIELDGRKLVFLDTPGHASHHYCVWDDYSKSFFTGDSFGLSYRELDVEGKAFIFPTTSPVQFKPEVWIKTLDKLAKYSPEKIQLTHYGQIRDVERLMGELRNGIDVFTHIACECKRRRSRYECIRTGLLDFLIAALRRHGLQWSVEEVENFLRMDLKLNSQGLEVWLDRR